VSSFFETRRLQARRVHLDDLDPFVAYRSDPEVARYQSWSDYTVEQGRALITSQQGIDPGIPGAWYQIALESRGDGGLVGDLALHVSFGDRRLAEIGFTLARSFQGKGLAGEALEGYLDWLFPTFNLHRVHAVTDARNSAAAALLKRVGMRREAHLVDNVWFKGAWGSEYIYAVLADEVRRES
jgi:RimJ/RimL family protein N-acetyltransferase